MRVRAKTSDDAVAAVDLLHEVHLLDGYPSHWPDDPMRFMNPPYEERAWVAEADDGSLVGHVALHGEAAPPTMALALRVTGLAAADVAVVSRLLVGARARRQGLGRRLLDLVTAEAHGQGRLPILDTGRDYVAARALYDSSGYEMAGEEVLTFSTGDRVPVSVYIGPPPPS